MLLFHGTRLDRRGLRNLFAEGLRAHDRGWMHELTDERAFCFLSNAPVAGRGGDPVFFATARRYHPRTRSEGYVVVLDVTPAALESSLVGVFPNFELDQFLDASSFRRRPVVDLPALIRLGRSTCAGQFESRRARGSRLGCARHAARPSSPSSGVRPTPCWTRTAATRCSTRGRDDLLQGPERSSSSQPVTSKLPSTSKPGKWMESVPTKRLRSSSCTSTRAGA